MSKHTGAHKQVPANDAGSPKPVAKEPEILTMPAQMPPAGMQSDDVPPWMAWPTYVFEMVMTPWRNFAPMGSWREDRKFIVPKSESSEDDKEYIYRVQLPDITREQAALYFQNGSIMLRVEGQEDERDKGFHYRHARSIRRAFSLPVYTDAEKITAELKEGVLTIVIPKSDKPVSPQSRLIEIR